MEQGMTNRICVPAVMVAALFLGTLGAYAQTIGPDEAIRPDGAVSQRLALTAAQKSAIYNAVAQQRVRPSSSGIAVAVGAPVPPNVELRDLPDQALAGDPLFGDPWAALLKYAMVDDDVVVVDSIRMRVVEIIYGSAKP
jgi:hypothetical protein